MLKHCCVVVIVAMCCIVAPAWAKPKPWKPPSITFKSGQAGYHLERAFAKLRNQCGYDNKAPALPPQLYDGDKPRLDAAVEEFGDVGLSKFLTYVWPTRLATRIDMEDPRRFLRAIPIEYRSNIRPETEMGSLEYSQNCTGTALLNAAAKGGLGAINIGAALDAEQNQSYELTLLHGTFYSPLQLLLMSPSEARRHAILSIWDFYSNQSPESTLGGYYVSGFTGTVVASGSREERKLSRTANAAVGFASPMFSASANGSLSYERRAKTIVSDFIILAAKESHQENSALRMRLEPMPTVASLRAWFAEMPLGRVEFHETQWKMGGEYVVRLGLRGVPTDLRDITNWSVSLENNEANRLGMSPLRTTPPGDPVTEEGMFNIKFTLSPTNEVFTDKAAARGTVQVAGKLLYNRPIKGEMLERPFSLTANLSPAHMPTARLLSTSTSTVNDSVKVVWQIAFTVDGMEGIDTSYRPKVRMIGGIPCKEVGAVRIVGEGQYDSVERAFAVTAELLVGSKAKVGGADFDYITCSAGFEVDLRLKAGAGAASGTVITRSMYVPLGLPRWKHIAQLIDSESLIER